MSRDRISCSTCMYFDFHSRSCNCVIRDDLQQRCNGCTCAVSFCSPPSTEEARLKAAVKQKKKKSGPATR